MPGPIRYVATHTHKQSLKISFWHLGGTYVSFCACRPKPHPYSHKEFSQSKIFSPKAILCRCLPTTVTLPRYHLGKSQGGEKKQIIPCPIQTCFNFCWLRHIFFIWRQLLLYFNPNIGDRRKFTYLTTYRLFYIWMTSKSNIEVLCTMGCWMFLCPSCSQNAKKTRPNQTIQSRTYSSIPCGDEWRTNYIPHWQWNFEDTNGVVPFDVPRDRHLSAALLRWTYRNHNRRTRVMAGPGRIHFFSRPY